MIKHEAAKMHMDSSLKLVAFRMVNIATHLYDSYRIAVCHHNDEVSKNRHTLRPTYRLCEILWPGRISLERQRGESKGSRYTGIFHGLVDLVASLDEVFEKHLKLPSHYLFGTGFNL